MQRRNIDLAAVGALALLAAVLVLAGVGQSEVRLAVGLPLVLLLPGYALVGALVIGELGLMERLLLSIGTSIGLAVLGGFLLNLTPWGITPSSWAVLLGGMTIPCCVLAARRRRTASGHGAATLLALPWQQALTFGLAAVVLVGAIGLARGGALAQPTPGFTQFWLLPGVAQGGVQVGIHNQEAQAMTYTLEIAANDQALNALPSVTIASGETWQTTISLPAEQRVGTVEARLYRANDRTQVYRRAAIPIGQ